MAKTYCDLYYHATWGTYERHPIITPDIERVLHPFIDNKAKRFGGFLHTVGGIEDHIHVVVRIPASMSVGEFLGKLKGASSYFLNQELQITNNFRWQEGYGVSTVSFKELRRVIGYVRQQKQHHRDKDLFEELERTEGEEEKEGQKEEGTKETIDDEKPVP